MFIVAAFLLAASATVLPAQQPSAVGSLVIKLIDQIEVPALVSGPLHKLDADVGDSVRAGQVIARVDDRESIAERDMAKTALEISRQKSSEYRNDEIAATELKEKQASLDQQCLLAKIAHEKSQNRVRVLAAEKAEAVAKNEWKRAEKAREKYADSVSESEIENLSLQYERSVLERKQATLDHRLDQLTSDSEAKLVQVAELAVARAKFQNTIAISEGNILRLDVEAKQQTLKVQELTVERHQVLSPIDGVIVDVFKRGGEWVKPGDAVARVINLDQLHAEGFLSGDVRPARGQQVRLKKGDQEVVGSIDFVSSERDSVSGEVRFLVRLRGGTFLPGDRVDIEW